MASLPPTGAEACQFCGNRLAVGAVACFRCGKMVERPESETSGSGALPTQLSTQAKGDLLADQWRLVKLIGQGAVGSVWQAQDVGLDRSCAVKIMHERLIGDETAAARFERESRVLAKLEHPNIVPVLGVGMYRKRPFLVMKQLEGRTLAEYLHTRGGRLTAADAVPIISQLCEALDFVHGTGVVHRDLKPSNVFIGNERHVWLLDLGLAYEPGSDLTHSGDVLGAVQYLSPEQLVGKRDVDARSDVFSLGCLAFEMFVGHPPFVGEPRDVLAHQLHTGAPDVSVLVPGVPKAVGALLRKAMAKIPLERPASAGELALELSNLFGLAADGTVSKVLAPPLVMPRRDSAKELPSAQDVATRQADVTPQAPREAATAPIEGPTVPREALSGTPTPTLGPGETLIDESIDVGSDALALRSREGPTGPTERQKVAQAKRTALVLAALAALIAVGIGGSFFIAPTPLPAPVPVPRVGIESVAQVTPPTAQKIDMTLTLPEEPPKPPSVTAVAPGQETYKSFSYSRYKEVRPRHVEVKGGRSGNGQPELEVRVFSPQSDGHQEVKADVVLDDQHKGLSPLKLHLRAGEHVLQVIDRPYPMTEMLLTALPGAKQVVEIELLPAGSEAWMPEANLQTRHR